MGLPIERIPLMKSQPLPPRERFFRFLGFALILSLVLLMGTGCDKPAKPVARVGQAWIGQPQWQAYLKVAPSPAPSPTSSAEALRGLVRREVAWNQAEKRGLLKGTDWQEFQMLSRRSILAEAYLATEPGPSGISEQQAKGHFLASEETRHVVHVLSKTQKEAEAALKRIQRGEAIEKVAEALSKEPSAAQKHGDLGWIKRGQMVQAFADAVFSAKAGELCGPFQTEFGWHVAKVLEVKPASEEEFTRNKARIMKEIEAANLNARRPGALKTLKEKYPISVDKAVVDLDRTTVPAPGDETRIAARVAGTTISLKELKKFIADYLNVSGVSHGLGPETKSRFLDIIGDDIRLAVAAEKAGLDKRPETMAALWNAQRQQAYAAFSKDYLGSFKVSEAEARAHYTKHSEKFRATGALRLNLLVLDRAETSDAAMHEAAKGTPWKVLYAKYANKASTGDWDAGWVELAKLEPALPKAGIQALLKTKLDSPVGPVPTPEGMMLFKVLERRPGPVLPLDACREEVRQDYVKEHALELLNKHLDNEGRNGLRVQEFPANASMPKGN